MDCIGRLIFKQFKFFFLYFFFCRSVVGTSSLALLARHLYSGLLGRKLHPGSPILLLPLPCGIKAAYSLRSSVSLVPANMVSE